MDPNLRPQERDLVLAPNEFAWILDKSKGQVTVWTGPAKTTISNTDMPVVFRNEKFVPCSLEEAVQLFATAPEGSYIVLQNPAKDNVHPVQGNSSSPSLMWGEKIHVTGPGTFPLWPGQVAEVVQGHRLRSNQFIVVRVVNEKKAKESWEHAIMKPQKPLESSEQKPEQKPSSSEGEASSSKETTSSPATAKEQGAISPTGKAPDLVTGQLLHILGTEVSFYIPPTGIDVVRDEKKSYVRDAVTLEQLEYCILVDEDGNKRYERGPNVVFPNPTETFVTNSDGTSRKFRAIELQPHWGVHVKVIASYTEGDRTFKEGEELFIRGSEQQIYFPRHEHAIIDYGGEKIHYAVAIPQGEGRYVLNRATGNVGLVEGPRMFLPDPREEVIVRRVLTDTQVTLWFPGNDEALVVNRTMREVSGDKGYVSDAEIARSLSMRSKGFERLAAFAEPASNEFRGDEFQRRTSQTKPRTIILDTKYEGAVIIDVHVGYAVQIVKRTGEREVVVGPAHRLLEYGDTLEVMELSTGTPKSDNNLQRTVYLRVLHNKVSDSVQAETLDLVPIQILLSYRVNFEGNNSKWFSVENYVKLLTDHIRSLLRNVIKRKGIEYFYTNAIDIIRDSILGAPAGEEQKRPGRIFEENGMRVYDVEVLDIKINNTSVSQILLKAQLDSVAMTIALGQKQKEAETVEKMELEQRRIIEAQDETAEAKRVLELAARDHSLEVAKKTQAESDLVADAGLARQKRASDQALDVKRADLAIDKDRITAETQALVDKAKAISPDLIAALEAFGDKNLLERVAVAMAPLAIVDGKNVLNIVTSLFEGTDLAEPLKKATLKFQQNKGASQS